MKSRPRSAMLSSSSPVMPTARSLEPSCTGADSAVTVMDSVTSPITNFTTPMARCSPEPISMPDCTYFLNPGAEIFSV